MAENLVERLKKSPLWPMIKRQLKDIHLEFDDTAKAVTIMNLKSGISHTMTFIEIEEVFNNG